MTTLAVKGIQSFARGGVKALTSLAVSTATGAISRALDNRVFEGPRLETFLLQTSRDGAPLPRVFGRVRLAGEVIWASQVRETQTDESVGGKGGGPTRRDYSYSISFAVSLCEGEILGVDRIWANGEVLQRAGLTIRVHTGSETQGPDPVIAATEGGDVPAFRGTAYIVFEDFPLDDYGSRLPSINAEVVRGLRRGGQMEDMIQSVNLLPGSGEFALSPTIVEETPKPGVSIPSNMNNLTGQADLLASLDQLQAELPNCRHVNLISAWFGTSLDAGSCEVHPGAERPDRILPDATWEVASVARGSAYIVSADEDGRPNYGGTPSDDSVIACIQELKQRGFSVTLYPFLLMDTPDFPWRGRIEAQSEADVISFFGSDEDFRFRHSILHHARLAQAAGGVDAIVIGSELRTLTSFRTEERFPAVEQLRSLAADVRAIAGMETKITYAADWSEYFGVQDDGDVRYHLDPLWADFNIDAVGIDAYFPLSDWRDGFHLDAQITGRPHDLDYLRANVEGGEGYDWYYASPEDRDAQIRTPIDDPVYRYKDMRHWWSSTHEERRNGVVVGQSPWVPRSKPVWLMEIGCPAINKGANQPNVFFDPKSSESALPCYSDGTRDDLIQRRYIEAFLSHYEETNEGGFIDLSRASVWAWDARPYPDFPARTEVWSDGPNWLRGHWLNGRTGLMPVADIVAELVSDAGLEDYDVSGVSGVLPGYIVDRPMSARAALGSLLQLFEIEMSERSGTVTFSIDGTDHGEIDANNVISGAVERTRQDPERTVRDVRLTYLDAGRDYQLGTASARDLLAESVAIADLTVPAILDEGFARAVAVRELEKAQVGDQSLTFSLPLASGLSWEIGDRLQFDGASWSVQALEFSSDVAVSARQIQGESALILSGPTPESPSAIRYSGQPQLLAFDFPSRSGVTVGALLEPFEPVQVEAASQDARLDSPVRVGATLTPLDRRSVFVRDLSSSLDIFLPGAIPAGVETQALFDGANRFAIETSAGWEIIAARDIELIAPQTYRLTHLLRGLEGSDPFMVDTVLSGARVVWLGSGLVTLPVSDDWRLSPVSVTGQSETRKARPATLIWSDAAGVPLGPVHPSWDGTTLSWIGRDPNFTDWSEDSSSLTFRVQLYRGDNVETVETSETALTVPPFDRADISQISAQGRESLQSATLIVQTP